MELGGEEDDAVRAAGVAGKELGLLKRLRALLDHIGAVS